MIRKFFPSKGHRLSTKRVLLTSFGVDLLDVITNTIVMAITGSFVMLAEVMQGLADVTSDVMLLIGYKRSNKHADKKHPFGYGKEIYFWGLMAAFVIMALTATLSFWFGLQQVLHPHFLEYITLAYIVLIIAVISNGYSLSISSRKLLNGYSWRELPKIFIDSPAIAPKTTVVQDGMGMIAAVFGLTALVLYGMTQNPFFDGLGAMIIGVMLAILAIILLFSVKGLVAGRSAPPRIQKLITETAASVPEVQEVLGQRTMVLGSNSLLVNLEVHIKDDLTTDQVENVMDNIKQRIIDVTPGTVQVHVEPETPEDKN